MTVFDLLITIIVVTILVTIALGVMTYIAYRLRLSSRAKVHRREDEEAQRIRDLTFRLVAGQPSKTLDFDTGAQLVSPRPFDVLLTQWADIAAHQRLSEKQVAEQLEEKLSHLKERIAKIEQRFPDDKASIEKYASINETILDERMRAMSERLGALKDDIDKLRGATLTKWDVAVIMSALIAGIAFIVGATVGIITYFS